MRASKGPRRAAAGLLLLASLGVPRPLVAHHANPVARAAAPNVGLGLGLTALDPPTVDVRIGSEFTYFSRLREDSSAREGGGALLVGTLVPAVHGFWATGTRAFVRLPVGFVRTAGDGAPEATSFGLGDLTVGVAQSLSPLVFEPGPLTVRLQLALVAPTGRYEPEAALSVTDVIGGASGAIDVVTYDTQASLGAGIWSGVVGIEIDWVVHPRWRLGLSSMLSEPLTDTSDGLRWGRDVDVQLGLSVAAWPRVLSVAVDVDYRWHDLDRIPADEGDGRERVGGRDEVGLGLGLAVRVADAVTCGGRTHLPIWQRAGGIQLVETLSVHVSCGYAFGL